MLRQFVGNGILATTAPPSYNSYLVQLHRENMGMTIFVLIQMLLLQHSMEYVGQKVAELLLSSVVLSLAMWYH